MKHPEFPPVAKRWWCHAVLKNEGSSEESETKECCLNSIFQIHGLLQNEVKYTKHMYSRRSCKNYHLCVPKRNYQCKWFWYSHIFFLPRHSCKSLCWHSLTELNRQTQQSVLGLVLPVLHIYLYTCLYLNLYYCSCPTTIQHWVINDHNNDLFYHYLSYPFQSGLRASYHTWV